MKSKRALLISLFALMLLLFCSALLFACSGIYPETHGDGAVADEAKSASTDETSPATSQQITTLNKSGSENSAEPVALSSSTGTGIYIGGGQITTSRSSDGGWRYDFTTNTLTLNGYYSPSSNNNTLGLTRDLFPDIPSLSCRGHLVIDSRVCTSLTIKVKGEYATYFGDADDSDEYDIDNYIYYGIYAPGVDLILDIEDDYAPMKYNPTYYPLQIYTNRDAVYCKSLTIIGGGGLWADSCIGSGINCQDLSVNYSRLLVRTQHGNNIYHGSVGHTTAAILASGSITFTGASVDVYVQNTAPKVGSIWASYMIDVYGIKAGTLHLKGGASVTVNMQFISDVTQNVTFKATGIQASGFTSYDGGKLYTKFSSNDSIPNNAYLSGCNIEDYAYFLGGYTVIEGELSKPSSKSFKLESFIQPFRTSGELFTSIEDTKYNYTANVTALYLRNNNGTLQYARNVLFNDAITLSSNEIDMADFADISTHNVYSVSGDWKIKPIVDDNTSTFVALGGSISLEMSGGNTYNALKLYAYTGATIYLSGDGIVNSLCATGCNEVGMERFVSCGTIYFKSGTVKSGWANSSCSVIFYGGNINIDYEDPAESSPYRKWTFDFGEYAELVSFQTDLSFSSGSFDRTGLYPIDGKLYSWDKYQTEGLSFRLFKYATVTPTDGYMYYLYPTEAEVERTFSMYRLTETDVFVGSNADTIYYLADGDTLTISVGAFAKQVTRPVTTFGGSTSTEILQGSTVATVPDGFTVSWTRTDRDGNVTKLGSELSLTAQVKALRDDGSVYTCSIRQGNTQVSEFKASVFVFDYNPTGLAPKLAGKDETVSFTFSFDDFKGYNDWIAKNYSFIWQQDVDGSGNFVDIAGTENQTTLSVTVESDDSYKALYRVRCYSSNYYVSGTAFKSYPTYYTTTTNLTFRELPYFNGGLSVSPADNYAGVTKYFSINLKNCYMGVVDCRYEYSTDDGQTWQRALDDPAFKSGLSIVFSSKYLSPYGNSEVTDRWYGSLGVEVTFTTEMNGWKLRCVMQSGDYVVYSNEATFTVLDFAGFTVQPESAVTLTSSDSLTLSAAFEEDYTDEDGNGISDVTYQWIYETWSNGSYGKVNTENPITTTTLYYENVSGIGSVSRYRLQVKFKYKGVDYTRYSDYAYVYILFPPAFDDGGVVIDNMADGLYTEGDSVSWKVNDNGVFFHYYKTYQFEISKDGGETWQSVGDAFTQSYLNTEFTFDLQSLSVADGGLYRCKVSITKNDLTVCSYSDTVNIGVVSSLSVNGDPQSFAVTPAGKLTMSAKHEYSSNVSVSYQWQGYDPALGWVELASENYFDTDKQAMYAFGASLPSYEKYRCFVGYKLDDDVSVTAYTNEVAPILVIAPTITAPPVDQNVWLGNSVKFILQIDAPTENYTVLWEVSNDGGESWKNAIAQIQCEAGENDYSLLCNTTTYDMNGAMFRCTVTNAIGDTSESVVTEPVTLTVRSGHVKREQELLDALRNGMTEFKLLDDISLSATVIVNDNITLDLAGHILSYQSDGSPRSVIRITGNATLTITDSAPDAVHTNADLPLGGIIRNGSMIMIKAASKAGNSGDSFGGGVSIENGTLVFIGGTIYDCRATYGGGIYVSDSSHLSIEGGVIDSCSATEGGGICSEGDIDIKDGSITNCTSSGTESNGRSDALYLNESTLNASGGTVDGTVHLKKSAVVMPEGSVSSTTFNQNVYCDNSAIKGGFYLSDVEGADTSNSFTVTYMNGDQTVTKLVVERGQKAIAVLLPTDDGYMYVWLNGDVAYDFDKQVIADLVLRAQWYVTAEVADDLTGKLDKTQTELDNTKSELSDTKSELDKTQTEVADAQSKIDSLNGNLSGATEDIEELNDKLSSVTAWMIVVIVLFGLSCGAIVPLLIFFLRKKGIK